MFIGPGPESPKGPLRFPAVMHFCSESEQALIVRSVPHVIKQLRPLVLKDFKQSALGLS